MKNKKLILIPALIALLAVSGCVKKETPKPVVNNNTNAQQVNSNVNENQGVGAVENGQSGEQGEEIDTSDWLTYRNEEYRFEVKYPSYLEKTEIVGEFYKGEEYPRIGVSFFDPKTDRGTFQEVSLNIYDEGWIVLGTDLFDPQIFDFNKVVIKNVNELKNRKEFLNGEIVSINNLSVLKVEKNYSLYLIFQNPKNSKFLIFSTINNQDSDEHKEINNHREKLMMEVLDTINFIIENSK